MRIQKFKEKQDSQYIAENLKNDGYQQGFASMVYNFFNKKSLQWCHTLRNKSAAKNENTSNKA